MQLRDVASLPASLDTRTAADLLGVGPDHLWALAREGDAPVEPLRLGRALRWPTAPLLALLGLEHTAGTNTVPDADDAPDTSRSAVTTIPTPSPEGAET